MPSLESNAPPPIDIKSHAASGFVYSGLAQAAKLITQFMSVIIMARLLDPSDFGLIAMVAPVYAFACLFSDLGLSQSILQRPRLSNAHLNTLFWLNMVLVLAFTALLVALSPVVGWFYNEPRTIYLTIAMALLVTIGGLGSQHSSLMVRKMDFRTQSMITMASSVLGLASTILVGYLTHSYWSLFVGMAVSTLVATAGVWIKIDWRPSRPEWAVGTSELVRYGLGITTGNLINFIVQNLSSILIGKMFGGHMLGLYDRASKLLASPLQQLISPISGIIVPILYRLHDDEERYRKTFLRSTGSLLFLIAPGVLWAIASSELLIQTLLGPKWADTAPLFAALSLAALPQLVNNSAVWLLITQGRSGDFARWSLWSGIASIAGIAIGIPFGIMGVAISRVVHQFVATPILWWFACRTGPVQLADVARTLVPQLFGIVVSAMSIALWAGAQAPGVQSALIGLTLAYASTATAVMAFPKGRLALSNDLDFLKLLSRQIHSRFQEWRSAAP